MKRRYFLKAIGLGAVAITSSSTLTGLAMGSRRRDSSSALRPNIILIMSDDMGYSDIGCYGSEIKTPVLDGLAGNGLRFTHFYNTARCCPTRASLMTGLYPHQAGVGHMMDDRGVDGYRGDLNRNCVTIAEVMKTAGYSTYMTGKWHVTKKIKPESEDDKYNWPCQRGFDQFYGTIHGAGSFFDPNTLTRNNTYITPYNDPKYKPEEFYYTDAISDHASMFIREHHKDKPNDPFFMYVAFTCAHWPMHALPKDIAKYKGRYDCGYEPIRKARWEKMKELGVIKPDAELSPAPDTWDSNKDKQWEATCMEVYAAMIDNMDAGIGRIIQALKDTDRFENTLICFFQDNGGCAEGFGRGGEGRPRADKPSLPPMDKDELQTQMVPHQSRDGYPNRNGVGSMPGGADTFIGYGRNWANVSNTPFREYKHWVHEGGISTPLIAHWPAYIKSKNELRHQPGHLIDMMATCVDVSGANYPKKYKANMIKPMEGRSLVTAFNNKPMEREIYWEHEGNRAVRMDNWKLVAKGRDGKWELYDIEKDRSELHDLAEQQPERVKDMNDKWQAYAERANVIPWPVDKKSQPKNKH